METIGFKGDRGWQLHTDGLIIDGNRGILSETSLKHGYSEKIKHMSVLLEEKISPLDLECEEEKLYACPQELPFFDQFRKQCSDQMGSWLYKSKFSAIQLSCYEDEYDGGVCEF